MKRLAWLIAALLATPACLAAQTSPTQQQPLDAQARALMWTGHAHRATDMMRDYVDKHPDDNDAVLDLARYLTWAGDYAAARHLLDTHPAATQSNRGKVVLAGVMAWAGWTRAALDANSAPLAADPQGLLPNYTQAIALRETARPREALPYVDAVKRAKPGSRDARDLERAVRIHTDSFVELDYQHGSDSDHLERSMPSLRAELAQGEALRWTLDLGRWSYRSPLNSPFVAVYGKRSVHVNRGLVGLRYAPSLYTTLSIAGGSSSINGLSNVGLWRVALDHRFADSFRGDLSVDHDRLDVSPRSLTLGLDRTRYNAHAQWTPDFNWTGDLWLRRDDISDGNNSLDINAALRRAVVRKPGFMLDLGGAAQHMSFDHNPGNGYYAPHNYRRYAATAFMYVGLGPNAGLSVQTAIGRQRDENLVGWRSANDISARLVMGIFSSWQLSLNAAYSQRLLNTGAYEGRTWGITLTRRF